MSFAGVPLKFISLVTLVVQNSLLTVLLHYSRADVAPDKMYSAASAVVLNELLKGAISLSIAFYNSVHAASPSAHTAWLAEKTSLDGDAATLVTEHWLDVWEFNRVRRAASSLRNDIFSRDCWKLSIPACLYVIQNNLQFVAASNLDAPTFQVSYNLKILTTALFSVLLLKRRLSTKKWLALLCLAGGVGIVQIQSSGPPPPSHAGAPPMDQMKGLLAVACGCMTSGLAGVYFEMVLKGSNKVDLWTRNCQLSFFSLLPALVPVYSAHFSLLTSTSGPIQPLPPQSIFANFGVWAWAVVLTQVVGGLVTALVIKYSDNILKGFATSLAIVLSFVAGVILFDFQVTSSFVVGTLVVVGATYLYNLPDTSPLSPHLPAGHDRTGRKGRPSAIVTSGSASPSSTSPPYRRAAVGVPGTPDMTVFATNPLEHRLDLSSIEELITTSPESFRR